MDILTQVQTDQLEARKSGNTTIAKVLTTLLGEFDANTKLVDGEKFISDEDMLAIIRKFIKNNKFTLEHCGDDDKVELMAENEALESYLPLQLTDEELKEIIDGLPDSFSIGQVMSFLKTKYNGLYDGAKASELARAKNV